MSSLENNSYCATFMYCYLPNKLMFPQERQERLPKIVEVKEFVTPAVSYLLFPLRRLYCWFVYSVVHISLFTFRYIIILILPLIITL